jgi:hypothetical protein
MVGDCPDPWLGAWCHDELTRPTPDRPIHHLNARSTPMNPMPTLEIVNLYGLNIHAGGWPKLGWCRVELDDEV